MSLVGHLAADLGPGVVGAELRGGTVTAAQLHAEEQARASALLPARARDFARGRVCGHRALAAAGAEHTLIRVGPAREPNWPAGFTGSITHTGDYAAALVAPCSALAGRGIGLDAVLVDELHDTHGEAVFVPEERDWLTRQSDPQLAAAVCFAAKEAFFKARFPLHADWVEFDDLRVLVVGQRRLRVVRKTGAGLGKIGVTGEAIFRRDRDLVVVAVVA